MLYLAKYQIEQRFTEKSLYIAPTLSNFILRFLGHPE